MTRHAPHRKIKAETLTDVNINIIRRRRAASFPSHLEVHLGFEESHLSHVASHCFRGHMNIIGFASNQNLFGGLRIKPEIELHGTADCPELLRQLGAKYAVLSQIYCAKYVVSMVVTAVIVAVHYCVALSSHLRQESSSKSAFIRVPLP